MNGEQKEGLYWTPRGGNNAADIWSSCHMFESVVQNGQTGKTEKDKILVDVGQIESVRNFADGKYDCAVPVLDDCLEIPGQAAPAEGEKVQAIFITHGHSDHINGLLEYARMGVELPPVYASPFTINMIMEGFVSRRVDWDRMPELRPIGAGDKVTVGNMTVEALQAPHSIPGSLAFKISNPEASIFHSGDIKADPSSFLDKGLDEKALRRIGQDGGVDLMTFDATATHMEGHARHEAEICSAYEKLFRENGERQIIAPISAAHMERLATVVAAAERAGKHVIIDGGPSMDRHILGLSYAEMHLDKMFSGIKVMTRQQAEQENISLEKTVTITTGIYANPGDPFSQALKGENDRFALREDAVIIAPLIGDRYEKLEKLIAESPKTAKATLITGREHPDLYGSGHAQKDDFRRIASCINPRNVAPIHCSEKMADSLIQLCREEGYSAFPRQTHNGETMRVSAKDGCEIVGYRAPDWYGVKFFKRDDGVSMAKVEKAGDNGFSVIPAQEQAFEQKRREAERKIAEYRQKHKEPEVPALRLKKASYGR
ncbi:MAG: MBL fold metallo-hydrolase [Alphaproteobacteria bacterium]|jgi:mRNA degradation ribonuclease J1/J2